jgi:hypothetical protein
MTKSVTQALALALVVTFAQLAAGQAPAAAGSAKRHEMVPPPLRAPNASAFPAHPSPYNFPGVEYPRIEADGRVTFHFKAPDAQKVQVSIVNVPFDMVKGADGVWTYTSQPQDPGYHNYWMVVDGAVVLDPGTQAFMGYSHMCNGFEIPEPGVTFYDIKDVPHGNVLVKNYFAKMTNSWRRIFVYTPPGYDTNLTTRYPVLYLQHGGGEDERVWVEMGRVNVILDNLLAEKKVQPFIVVMESMYVNGVGAAAPGSGRGGAPGAGGPAPSGAPPAGGSGFPGIGGPSGGTYGQLLTTELIPWVDANFRTLTDKDHRGMAGLSMGGVQTAAITMVNLDKFSYIGLLSGGTTPGFGPGGPGSPMRGEPAAAPPFDIKTAYSGAMANPAEFNKRVKIFFFSTGTKPPLENPDGLTKHQKDLVAAGITNSYLYISPDTSHEWQAWRRSFYALAPLLFRD